MRKTIILSTLFFCVITTVNAQQYQITGVKPLHFRGVESITNGDKAVGYYTYYLSEKLKKGMVTLNLDILDLDLNLIKQTPVTVTKRSALIGSEYNGKDFLFIFSDAGKKLNTFITIDGDGNIIKREDRKHRKFATANSMKVFPGTNGNGFYVTSAVKEKKWGYSVEKIDRDLNTVWEESVTRDRGYVGIEAAEAGNNKLLLITIEKPSLMSKKVLGKLVSFDDNSGTKQFEYDLYNGEITGLPSAFLVEPNGNIVTAGMYFEGSKWQQVNSDGIFFLKLSPEGKQLAFNKIDWDNGIKNALKATSRKFSIGSKPKVLFHEITKTGGSYQVIAETFRKTVKAGTLIAAAGGSSNAPMGFTVMDYIIFNYDDNGKPLDINKIEKPYKSILIDGTVASAGGVSLAYYLKRFNMFTFEYVTTLPDSGKPAIVYTNWEGAKLGSGKPYVGISTIARGEESETKKIPMSKKLKMVVGDSKKAKTGALRSKAGHTCIYAYDRKSKTVNIGLESLTF